MRFYNREEELKKLKELKWKKTFSLQFYSSH